MSDVILSVKDLKVNYGGIEAVKGISFDVPRGEIVTLIGANGAGKSTTLKAIAGLVKPSAGSIEFNGANITGKDPVSLLSPKAAACLIICPSLRTSRSAHICAVTVWMTISSGCIRSSRASRSEAGSWPVRSPAASSRCLPLPVR